MIAIRTANDSLNGLNYYAFFQEEEQQQQTAFSPIQFQNVCNLSESSDVLDDGRSISCHDDNQEDEYPHQHPEAHGQVVDMHRAATCTQKLGI